MPGARAADTDPEVPGLEEVLVTGRQPGPGLWKVTRPDDPDGHVVWVLGNHEPLPRGLEWRGADVEDVLEASQLVVGPPTINTSIGPLRGLTLLPALVRARDNPGGRSLREVVPADLYARWLPLKARYLGEDRRVERWRPIFAANQLYRAALEKADLVPYEGVWPRVEKLARRARVPVRRPALDLEVEKPREAIREFKQMPLDDLDCFERTLQRLETDLDLMRERANAWAEGNVARLRALVPVQRGTACIGALLESGIAQERGYGDAIDRARRGWLAAVEQAIGEHASTLAVISIEELLRPEGHIATLRRKGYLVEDP